MYENQFTLRNELCSIVKNIIMLRTAQDRIRFFAIRYRTKLHSDSTHKFNFSVF